MTDVWKEYDRFSGWPFERPGRRPCLAYRVQRKTIDDAGLADEYCPNHALAFSSVPQAAFCSSWHMAQVWLLEVLLKSTTFVLLRTHFEKLSSFAASIHTWAEQNTRNHVDAFCVSIPYITNPESFKSVVDTYQYDPPAAFTTRDVGPEVMAAMAQIQKTLEVGSESQCVPVKQRRWLQKHLTRFVRDRNPALEMAQRLEIKGYP